MNPAPDISTSKLYIICVENFFCFYFTFEVLVRLLSFKVRINEDDGGYTNNSKT